MSSSDKVPDSLIDLILKTLEQQGVTLTKIDTSKDPVEFYINIHTSRLIASLEDTLSNTYGILWVLTYGKVTDLNRDCKIQLNYQETVDEDN